MKILQSHYSAGNAVARVQSWLEQVGSCKLARASWRTTDRELKKLVHLGYARG